MIKDFDTEQQYWLVDFSAHRTHLIQKVYINKIDTGWIETIFPGMTKGISIDSSLIFYTEGEALSHIYDYNKAKALAEYKTISITNRSEKSDYELMMLFPHLFL